MKKWFVFILISLVLMNTSIGYSLEKGIYINQFTAENSTRLQHLSQRANSVGIHTLVIDLNRFGPRYDQNILLMKQAGFKLIARIVVFPHGGTREQVASEEYWEQRYRLVQHAVDLGFDEVQLDYIRYRTSVGASNKNAYEILNVISFYKERLKRYGIPLQIDVFGEVSFKPSRSIGQDINVFAGHVDAINPMVYPSHYEPYKIHARQPYLTVYQSLKAMQNQFAGTPPFRIYAWIELYNYRYPMSYQAKKQYIQAEIQAAEDAGVEGWYAWSPNNRYEILFDVLSGDSD